MKPRTLLIISLALNVIFVPAGAIYLIYKVEFVAHHQPVTNAQLLREADFSARFVSMLEYKWLRRLFE